MALSRSNTGAYNSSSAPHGTTAFTTGSFTPPNNSLLVVAVGSMINNSPGNPGPPTISGGSLTFTQRTTCSMATSYGIGMTVFTAPVATGASMTIQVDNDTGIDDRYGWSVQVVAYTGYDTGTPVAGAVNSGTADIGDGAETQTLGATPTSDDEAIFWLYVDCSTSTVAATASGWTQVFDSGATSGGGTLATWIRTGSTSTSVSVGDVYGAGGSFFKGIMASLIIKASGALNPYYVNASTGTTDATGAWSHTSAAPAASGNLYIVQFLQDGTSASAPAIDSVTNAANLAGTANVLTFIGAYDVGSPAAAKQHLYIGRATSTSAMVITGSNVGGDDVYVRVYEFARVNTGTTLAQVIENGTAGTATNGAGTSGTVADTAVTTLGPDRLACNFIAVDDDNQAQLTAMTGATGGTWAYPVAAYGASTGTDGAIALVTATMSTAGTIDGATDAMDSDNWGVIGFALIGTAVSYLPRYGYVHFNDPAIV